LLLEFTEYFQRQTTFLAASIPDKKQRLYRHCRERSPPQRQLVFVALYLRQFHFCRYYA